MGMACDTDASKFSGISITDLRGFFIRIWWLLDDSSLDLTGFESFFVGIDSRDVKRGWIRTTL